MFPIKPVFRKLMTEREIIISDKRNSGATHRSFSSVFFLDVSPLPLWNQKQST